MAKGAHIIWTPWRSHHELLQVKAQLYRHKFHRPATSPKTVQDEEAPDHEKRQACSQISAWKLRAPLPHALESTWLLTEAALADAIPSVPLFAVKAAYVTAISRFVTAHLDPLQPPLHKRSMYALAQEINLPAVFVDIRHDGAHGELPSLDNLRDAAVRALEWLWDHYWAQLEGDFGDVGRELASRKFDKIGDDVREGGAGIEGGDEEGEEKVEQPGGWTVWEGPWVGKAIGVVP